MQFKDIEGQRILINHLTEIIDAGRISHAQMFLGPTSSGSLALAIAYAQYLCCEHRQHYPASTGDGLRADSCGECPSCRKFQELVHPDLHFIFPNAATASVSSNPSSDNFQEEFRSFLLQGRQRGTLDDWYAAMGIENKQGIIRERDAASIVRTLSLKAYEGGHKMLVIWMAERMNLSAANTLLKTLEEPSGDTLILLVAESSDRILPTIISRVQQVTVPDQGALVAGARREQFATLLVQWMRMLFKLNIANLSAWIDQVAVMGREVQCQFLLYAQESMRACFLRTAAGVALEAELQFGDEKFNSSFPAMVTVRNIEPMCTAFDEAVLAIERNAHPKIAFMHLSFQMSRYLKNR